MYKVIETQGLTKHYKGFDLCDVSLVVPQGMVVGIIGSNGSGKTTTLKSLLGLTMPDEGTVDLFGQRVYDKLLRTGFDDREMGQLKERIGVVFDACAFPEELRVKDTAAIMRASYKQWDQELFESYLKKFELEPTKRAKELSRGMGMRLTLACALSHRAELLILDEPTAGLDPLARDEILQLFQEFMEKETHSILISSHITSDLERIADYIVCIDDGRIIFSVEKDSITDEAGIAHCRSAEFQRIRDDAYFEPGTLRYIKQGVGVALLVHNRFEFQQAYKDVVVTRTGIDEYLNLVLKGTVQ